MSSVKTISSEDCFKKLNEDQNSYLIDVRSPSEWNVDGIPDEDSFEGILFKLAIRNEEGVPVSYTHLTLPTILRV